MIWQCNNKYKGTKVCRMPHLYEDGLQAEFLKLCNKVVSNREREIADLRVLLAVIGGTEELETKKAGLEAERDALEDVLPAPVAEAVYRRFHPEGEGGEIAAASEEQKK